MAQIRFLPDEAAIACEPGQNILELATENGVGIASACGGKGNCGLCRIVVQQGEEHISPYNEAEEKHLGNLHHLTKLRLSCQCVVLDEAADLSVEIKRRPKVKPSVS